MDREAAKLLDRLRGDFIGLDTTYVRADGRQTRRVYLDSTASTLMMRAAHDAVEAYYRHYANTHSLLHYSARISTTQYRWAHDRILSFLGADPERYTCVFMGSGATACINRMARVFRDTAGDRDVAMVSMMEHHSNDLPHRKHAGEVVHIPLEQHVGHPGCVDMEALAELLEEHGPRVKYVAVTGVSNVTGIVNPVHDIAEIAHRYGALLLVDGAQMAAHMPVRICDPDHPERNIDAFVFSGHKTYVPGSPGVLICRKDLLACIEPEEVGGGMVESVLVQTYTVSDRFPEREEAGTPNIPGAIGLAAAVEVLARIGMPEILEDETALLLLALKGLKAIDDLVIYGCPSMVRCPRVGSISFNLRGLPHGLTAAILNDHYNIAVRNECFCAHPYVKEMILEDLIDAADDFDDDDLEREITLRSGMVRASLGLYSTREDVELLVQAMVEIAARQEELAALYQADECGEYRLKAPETVPSPNRFSVTDFLTSYLEG
ncbi:MAG TPA: aminotransferase class V-fold PLP-dependent enzyme [Myxococcota bacterium]|nr:aminotransferase class V-fold PLP-dependent enzyme [Myxococcota bacterium]